MVGNPDSTQRSLATGIVAELEADGYHDAEPIGRGGFGVVYRCREPSLDRVVAIKVLSADQDDVELEHFEREQRAMGRVWATRTSCPCCIAAEPSPDGHTS